MGRVENALVLATALIGVVCACVNAERAGGDATAGALQTVAAAGEAIDPSEPGRIGETIARGAVRGSIDQASQPEELAQLSETVRVVSASAMRGADIEALATQTADGVASALARELARTDEGSLGAQLAVTTRQMSASAVRGARDELATVFPECTGFDRRLCIERRIESMSFAAASGVADGLRGLVSVPLIIIAFLLGVLTAVALSWTWSRHHSSQSHARNPRLRRAH